MKNKITYLAAALALCLGACCDDTLTNGAPDNNSEDALRVVSLTLDGRELGATATTTRATYDTSTDGSAFTKQLETNGNDNDGHYYNKAYNRIITELKTGDALKGGYSFENEKSTDCYLQLDDDEKWYFYDRNSDNSIGKRKTNIRPTYSSEKSESWENATISLAIEADALQTPINNGENEVACVKNADLLSVRTKAANARNLNAGEYYIGSSDTDRGQMTLNLVHDNRALLEVIQATISGWLEGYNTIASLRADQNSDDGTDVDDNNTQNITNPHLYRPVFDNLYTDKTTKRWQAIVLAKRLISGTYGSGSTDNAYNLRRLHVRLCKTEDDGNVSATSQEFIVTLGGETGVEMKENHSYRLALSLTPSHLSAATATTFPTWVDGETETELISDDFKDDKGTWYIYTAKGLTDFRDAVNATDGTLNANLCRDIDLSSVCHASGDGAEQVNWTPIGTTDNPYQGSFNGQGHTISNLYINVDEAKQGLFGCISGTASISNLTMKDANVTTTGPNNDNNVATIIGYVYEGKVTIENCHATNCTITGNNGDVGTIIGGTNNNNCYVKINNCSAINCNITNKALWTGGIAGGLQLSEISNCTVKDCTITGHKIVGGIVGTTRGNVKGCKVSGTTKIKDLGNSSSTYRCGTLVGGCVLHSSEETSKISISGNTVSSTVTVQEGDKNESAKNEEKSYVGSKEANTGYDDYINTNISISDNTVVTE